MLFFSHTLFRCSGYATGERKSTSAIDQHFRFKSNAFSSEAAAFKPPSIHLFIDYPARCRKKVAVVLTEIAIPHTCPLRQQTAPRFHYVTSIQRAKEGELRGVLLVTPATSSAGAQPISAIFHNNFCKRFCSVIAKIFFGLLSCYTLRFISVRV